MFVSLIVGLAGTAAVERRMQQAAYAFTGQRRRVRVWIGPGGVGHALDVAGLHAQRGQRQRSAQGAGKLE